MKPSSTGRSLARAKIMSADQAENVFQAALQILERTGVKVESEEALKLLKGGGAIIADGYRARIPRELIAATLESVPKKLTIFDRDGAPALRLGEGNTYYAPGMTSPNVLDPLTGERRPFERRDSRMIALLSDALPNIDFVSTGGVISDVTAILAGAYEFAEIANNSSKPLFAWGHNERILEDIYQMACALAGGEESFREKPNFLFFANPVSPLVHSPEVAGRILVAAEHSIPFMVWPAVLAGATTPITPASAVAVSLAEVLSGMAIHQSRRPGAPFIFATSITPLDMKRGIATWGPLRFMAIIAINDVMAHLGVIRFVPAAGSNSNSLDQQASLEATQALLSAALAGPDLTGNIGMLETAMTYSPGLLVLADDIVGICRRIRRGLVVDEDALAVDVVDNVGPGGHFLMEEHTLRHFKEEHWEPSLLDLSKYEEWDGRTLGDRVKEKVQEILSSHKPRPLPDKAKAAIDDVLRRAETREEKTVP